MQVWMGVTMCDKGVTSELQAVTNPLHPPRPPPPAPCRAYLLRSCMTRSTVTLKPQPHASLGLPAYVQFTSPIRRCGCGGWQCGAMGMGYAAVWRVWKSGVCVGGGNVGQ